MATTQQVKLYSGEWTLVVKANGGSVKVEKQVGTDWVTTDTVSADGAYRMDFGQTSTRFTPAGGAAYEVTR